MMRDDMDPKLAAAIARAYNNWLYDFCQTDPKRLKGVAMIPLHDPNEAVKEAQRAVGKLGFVGVFARPEPLRNMPWHSRYFDTVWSALEELGVPLGFHSAAAAGEVPQIGDRFGDNLLLRHVVSHPLENMVAMVDTIGGGVCERHPKLKLAFLECYCGWVSFLLHRMDNAMDKGRFPTAGKLKPSEYFQRQCWISTEHEKELPMIIELIGDDNIVFSTDYPHGDSDFPHAVEEFLEMDGVSKESQKKILWDNCARLYGLGLQMSMGCWSELENSVIPARAGLQVHSVRQRRKSLDSRLRGNDGREVALTHIGRQGEGKIHEAKILLSIPWFSVRQSEIRNLY